MNCAAAETWLLTARSASELPGAVRAHLAECRGCAKRLMSLTRTDSAVRRLAPGPDAAARQRLLDALQQTPQDAASVPAATPKQAEPERPSRRVPGWAMGVAAGLAAALLVAVGWIAGRATSPNPIVQAPANDPAPAPAPVPVPTPHEVPLIPPPAVLPVAPHPALPAGLAARAARSAAHVAADTAPAAQVEAFDEFAAAVRAEAVQRANAGDADGLPRLAGLHERLLKLGVARQLARVPEDRRAAVAGRIAEGLKAASDDVSAAALQLPAALAELLKPVSASCREAAELIRQGKPPAAPTDWPSPPTPLEAVAAHAIRVAGADQPLFRADECAQLATALAQSAAVLSAAGLSDDAGRVGDAMATVLDAGVATNLARVELADPAGTLKGEVTLVRERADRAVEPLELEVAKANPVARPGLEKALIASAPGHAKATGKPPKHVPGKGVPHLGPKK